MTKPRPGAQPGDDVLLRRPPIEAARPGNGAKEPPSPLHACWAANPHFFRMETP
jgi:hypothetical protein